jgi:hypothetical protein
MKFFTVQPSFTLDVPICPQELMPRVRAAIRDLDLRDVVGSAGACVDLKVAADERRFWSPHLNAQASESESGSQLYCRFSPRPEIWTGFMLFYLVIVCLLFASGIYGYVQWFLGDRPWALLFIPLGIGGILVLHVASLIGQGLSADQMQDLRERLDQVLAKAEIGEVIRQLSS